MFLILILTLFCVLGNVEGGWLNEMMRNAILKMKNVTVDEDPRFTGIDKVRQELDSGLKKVEGELGNVPGSIERLMDNAQNTLSDANSLIFGDLDLEGFDGEFRFDFIPEIPLEPLKEFVRTGSLDNFYVGSGSYGDRVLFQNVTVSVRLAPDALQFTLGLGTARGIAKIEHAKLAVEVQVDIMGHQPTIKTIVDIHGLSLDSSAVLTNGTTLCDLKMDSVDVSLSSDYGVVELANSVFNGERRVKDLLKTQGPKMLCAFVSLLDEQK